MCHASHFYASGTNLYFIFGIRGSVADYVRFRTGLVDAMVAAGGSPSHHHGVGRLMPRWLDRFLGREQLDVLRALKRHFDPNSIMNPGDQLGLEVRQGGAR
jgi:alkyldihydroxyacetonephosphate synthase